MIDIYTARKIAEKYLEKQEIDMHGTKLVIIDTQTITKDFGWVFFYNSKEFLETGNFSFSLVGNSPLIIDKNTGEIFETGTAHPIEYYLENFGKIRG